jgi:hypothetical protein
MNTRSTVKAAYLVPGGFSLRVLNLSLGLLLGSGLALLLNDGAGSG